jgi:hypothetical protein
MWKYFLWNTLQQSPFSEFSRDMHAVGGFHSAQQREAAQGQGKVA